MGSVRLNSGTAWDTVDSQSTVSLTWDIRTAQAAGFSHSGASFRGVLRLLQQVAAYRHNSKLLSRKLMLYTDWEPCTAVSYALKLDYPRVLHLLQWLHQRTVAIAFRAMLHRALDTIRSRGGSLAEV
jgi:hypothetical protein